MKANFFQKALIVLTAGLLLLSITWAVSASLLAYTIPWWTSDGGGGSSAGGPYVVSGTIAQADAGPAPMIGGSYQVIPGFWQNAASARYPVFLPVISSP